MSTLQTQVAKVALEAEEAKAEEVTIVDSPWGFMELRKYALEKALEHGVEESAEHVVVTAWAFLDFLKGEKK